MANTLKFGNGNWATQKGSVLAYNDENNNFKPLPFDFTRASTATYVDSDGLIKNAGKGEARIDYTDNTKGALKLEPARTNSLTYSNLFTWSGWSKLATGTGSTPIVTGNYAISPDGSQNASRLQLDKGSGTTTGDLSLVYETVVSVGTGSISIWMKSNDSNTYQVALRHLNFVVCDVTPEWQRFEFNNQASLNEIQLILRGTYGTSDDADILIYGAQLEAGSYATSYIPTQGSTVTRLADATIGNLPSSSIGQSEGVLYFEGSYFDTSETGYIELSDGGNDNRIIIWNVNSTSLRAFIEVGNNQQVQINGGSISSNTIFKFAFKYKTNDFALWVNGVEVGTATSGSTFGSNFLNQLDLQVSSVVFKGEIKDLKLYNTALTDAELAALTQV